MTGSRAEYGLLQTVLAAVRAHPRLELGVIVAGMHLLPAFGDTWRQVQCDGWPIIGRVRMQSGNDDPDDQALGIARGVAGFARCLRRWRAEIVVVLGDRIEAFAAAVAAATTGRVLAHIHGGDVAPGDFDDSLRDAITRLAHLHFAASDAAARRIARMGEDAARIHVVGAPGLDRMRELIAKERGAELRIAKSEKRIAEKGRQAACFVRRVSPSTVSNHRPFALFVQHAYGRPAAVEQRVADQVLRAVRAAGLRRVVIYPNSDRGHSGVIRAIERHAGRARPGEVELHRSLPRDEFLRLLLAAEVLVGNSSAGLIEAPFAGTPCVNVGQRQAGRLAGGAGVVHCGESLRAVREAIAKALRLRARLRRGAARVYGVEPAGARIAELLARTAITAELLGKRASERRNAE